MDEKVFYARVSTNKEEQSESLEGQQSYFKSMGINKGYIDQGITGTSIDRPQFLNMLNDAGLDVRSIKNGTKDKLVVVSSKRKSKFKYIYTKSISRFSRDTGSALEIIRELKENKVYVYFLDINTCTEGAGGEILISVMLAMSTQESQSISERVKFGNRQTAEKGTVRSYRAYGYSYNKEDKSLSVVEEERPVVELMFKLRAEGKGGRIIANTLNELGYKNRKGGEWKPNILIRMLKNPVYTGQVARNRYDCDYMYGNNTRVLKPKGEWIVQETDKIEPIISIELFDKVNNLIEEATQDSRKGGVYVGTSELAGKILCLKCNANYTKNVDTKKRADGTIYKRVFYNCSNKKRFGKSKCNSRNISQEELDSMLDKRVKEGVVSELTIFDVEEMVKDNFNKLNLMINDDNKIEIENNNIKIDELKVKLNRIIDAYIDGGIAKDILETKRHDIEKQILEIENINNKLGLTNKEIQYKIDAVAKLKELSENVWKYNIPIKKDYFIENYLKYILVGDGNFAIAWSEEDFAISMCREATKHEIK